MQILSTHWTCPQIAGANLGGLCPNYKRRDSNHSPPQKTSHSTSGQGHARKQTKSDSDQSPPRKQSSSDSDQSPPRKRSNCDSDQSPPRKHNQSGMRSSKKLGSESRMSTRLKAGLLTASDLKRENERKQTEEVEMYSKMDRSISEHFRRSHLQCEHSYRQHIYMKKPLYEGPDPPPNRFNIRPGY
ncbi:BUD13 homolog isoform X5 [Acropora muricata]|uniref:BUD13 homolog isoform X5 n=1 Tax=Acropora muricata TaxID=159855 RepID=UPI0034E4A702